MRTLRRPVFIVTALMFLTVVPTMAAVYTIHLKNGNSFESRYKPRIAGWDENKIMVTTTVLMPAASIKRASTGTFRVQSGQAGARRAASTSSSFIRRTTSGAYWSRQGAISSGKPWKPMKE